MSNQCKINLRLWRNSQSPRGLGAPSTLDLAVEPTAGKGQGHDSLCGQTTSSPSNSASGGDHAAACRPIGRNPDHTTYAATYTTSKQHCSRHEYATCRLQRHDPWTLDLKSPLSEGLQASIILGFRAFFRLLDRLVFYNNEWEASPNRCWKS
jgi:hypothetical protein